MMGEFKRAWRVFILIFILLLSGCSVESDRSDKPSEDWSRGLFLGQTALKQPTALQVDAEKHVHLVWCEITAEGGDALHYAQLDEKGAVVINQRLGVDLPNPRRPQLLMDGEGHLHLIWLSRSEGLERLYHTLIDETGQPAEPLLLSREGENVGGVQAYLSPEGEVALVWSGQRESEPAGIVRRILGDQTSPTLLVPQGIDPSVLVDRAGTVHLVWLVEQGPTAREVYYAALTDSQLVPPEGHRLSAFEFAESATYRGPIIGVDTDNLYVIWTVQNLGGGLTPTAAYAFYVSFETGQPAFSHPRPIGLPSESRPEYADHAGPYGYRKLAPLSPGLGSDFANAPATVLQQESELPVMFSLVVASTAESTIQLAMAVFDDGRPTGYELASETPGASVVSTLVADSDLDLHLSWLDTAGFGQYDVYYASTAPAAKRWLDRVSGEDLMLRTTDTVWGVMTGIGLVPIAAVWNFPPLIWVVLFFIFSGQEYLERTGTKIGLSAAILIYVGSKLLFLPGLAAGTPFLYRVPAELASALAVAVPVLILLLALGALALYARRSDSPTLFKGYLIFALTDGILTVVLYAPGLFNPG
jgi:hypothetical protein